jgi:hypothetical protein
MGPPKGLALAAVLAAVAATDVTTSADQERDLGREVLATNDGWASEGPGTTGGSAAVDAQVYTVTNRAELIAALNNGVVPAPPNDVSSSNPSNEPKIIYVKGTIDGNVDAANNPLACENYFSPDPTTGEMFSYEAFEAVFDPATWGRVTPTGPQERARLASQAAQQARVRIRPGSNTTIVGLGEDATIRGVWLDIRGSTACRTSRPSPCRQRCAQANGTSMFETGTLVDRTLGHDQGIPDGDPVSLLEEYNAITDPDIVDATGTTWQPTLFLEVDRTKKVPDLVRKCAGPFGPSCDAP